MTLSELKSLYNEAYRIIKNERRMREQVFRNNEQKREEKLVEIDRLLSILEQIKNVAKSACDEYEQPKLLDVPRKIEYR